MRVLVVCVMLLLFRVHSMNQRADLVSGTVGFDKGAQIVLCAQDGCNTSKPLSAESEDELGVLDSKFFCIFHELYDCMCEVGIGDCVFDTCERHYPGFEKQYDMWLMRSHLEKPIPRSA